MLRSPVHGGAGQEPPPDLHATLAGPGGVPCDREEHAMSITPPQRYGECEAGRMATQRPYRAGQQYHTERQG